MSAIGPTPQHRFLVSPDGMRGAWVHPLDPQDLYAGWTDTTNLSDDEFHALIVELQRKSEA